MSLNPLSAGKFSYHNDTVGIIFIFIIMSQSPISGEVFLHSYNYMKYQQLKWQVSIPYQRGSFPTFIRRVKERWVYALYKSQSPISGEVFLQDWRQPNNNWVTEEQSQSPISGEVFLHERKEKKLVCNKQCLNPLSAGKVFEHLSLFKRF